MHYEYIKVIAATDGVFIKFIFKNKIIRPGGIAGEMCGYFGLNKTCK